MGGYGALLLAERMGTRRIAAMAASSPALFPDYENARATNRFAFDDPADFARRSPAPGRRPGHGMP